MGVRDDISALESKISRLKVEYEQYFTRVVKREPVQLRKEVDRLILSLSNRNFSNTSMKFKYNTLVAKYNSYKQYWNRTLRAIEEGRYTRRAEGSTSKAARTPAPAPPSRPASRTEPAASGAPGQDKLKEVYEQYLDARKSCNESTKGVTYEAVSKTVEKQIKNVENKYKTKDVDLKVYVKDGKAKLAIRPKKK